MCETDVTTGYRHRQSTQNWEECGRKQLLATLKCYPGMCLEELKKTMKNITKQVGVVVIPYTSIQEVLGSNLGQDTSYPA
jgi:hypothetical protein